MRTPKAHRHSPEKRAVDPYYGEPLEDRSTNPDALMAILFVSMFLVICLVFFFISRQDGPGLEPVDEAAGVDREHYAPADVLEGYRMAHGGHANISRLHTKTVSGTLLREQAETPFRLQVVDTGSGQIRLDLNERTTITYTLVGQSVWLNRFHDGELVEVAPVTNPLSLTLRQLSELTDPLLRYATEGAGELLEFEPMARTYGADTIRLRIAHSEGAIESDFYIDADSLRLLTRIDRTPDGNVLTESIYTDYRTVHGIPQATRLLVRIPGEPEIEWRLDRTFWNGLESPKVFLRSGDSDALRELRLTAFE